MPRRGRFYWNFFPGHMWGWRAGFPPMGWRWRMTKSEELEWLKDYEEELKAMKEELEEELKEVRERIRELEQND